MGLARIAGLQSLEGQWRQPVVQEQVVAWRVLGGGCLLEGHRVGREGLQGEGLRVVRALKSLAASTRPILQHTGMYFRMPADGRWQGVQAICQRAVNRLILGEAQRRAFHEAGALAQHGILVRFMRQHKAMASAEALHRRVYSAAAWWIKKTLFFTPHVGPQWVIWLEYQGSTKCKYKYEHGEEY